MTQDKARKRATRERAGGTRDRRTTMSYTAAVRIDQKRIGPKRSDAPWVEPDGREGYPAPMARADLERYLDESEPLFKSPDPYTRQWAYGNASRLYAELASHTDDATWKQAARMASQMYGVLASRVRFAHGIPSLRPKTEMYNLNLDICQDCGRSWQVDVDGACEHCPRLLYGPPADSREQAERLPAGDPVNLAVLFAQPEYDDY